MSLSCYLYDLENGNNHFVINVTVFAFDLANTNLDTSNKPNTTATVYVIIEFNKDLMYVQRYISDD